MRDEQRKMRHEAITQAAYQLLAAKGYDGTSMLSIAKAAKASNETLYRWYGDKRGLFDAMVRDNADSIRAVLEKALQSGENPAETLKCAAPLLLKMLLGDRAILLNRVAAADPSGELGAAIARGGRDTIQPLIANVIQAICAKQKAQNDQGDLHLEHTEWFLGLLIGDLQMRRAIGALKPLSDPEIETRSQRALDGFFRLVQQS
ncbi:MAG: TetR/AcrR family transcriptional regulator [Cognatishimia sp.]